MRVLLLGQTQSNLTERMTTLKLDESSVLEYVLKSDQNREKLLREAQILSSALEDTTNSATIVKAYRQLCHEHLEQEVAEAQHIALRRSGARGKKAREVLIELENKLNDSKIR